MAVLKLRNKLQQGESVVSLHHSLTSALGFYIHGIPIYFNQKRENETFTYQLANSEHIFDLPTNSSNKKSLEDIRSSGKFWILAHATIYLS